MSAEDEEPRRRWTGRRLSQQAFSAAAAREGELRHAVRVSAAVGGAFLVGAGLQLPQSYWAVFTAVIVVQTSIGGTITAAFERLLGTVVGGVVGVAAAYLRAQTILEEGLILSIAIAILAFAAAVRPSLRVAPITAAIVLVGGSTAHMDPIVAAGWRVLEILIGSIIGLSATLLIFPARARKTVALRVGQATAELAELLDIHARRLEGHDLQQELHLAYQASRKTLTDVEQAVTDAARESSTGLGDASPPEGLVDSLRRVRTDCVMVGRALAQPLSPAVSETLAPCAEALLRAMAAELRGCARALNLDVALADKPLAQPRAAFEEAVERMRQARLTSDMTFDAAARIYGLVFALESLLDNLADLADRVDELAATAPKRGPFRPQAAPAGAP